MPLSERILTWLRPGRPGAAAPPPGPEQAHRLFAARARSFHDLLDARAAALKAMAELEAALREGNTLSMSFIRARCTLVTVNVFKIIRHCNQIVDGRHDGPERAFARLRQRIETILDGEPEPVTGEMLLDLVRIDRTLAGLAGEPMVALAEAGAIGGIRIPLGFVLTAAATGLFFQRNQLYRKINHILQQMESDDLEDLHGKSAAIQELIQSAPMPPELETLLLDRFDRLTVAKPALRVAVHTSAIGEDFGRASFFAGLDHTELDVGRDNLIDACKAALASKYTPRAITHRLDRGLLHERCEMGIGVLVMVEAAVSGLCHTRSSGDPGDTLDLFHTPGAVKGDDARAAGHLRLSRVPPHRIVWRREAGEASRPGLTDAEAITLAETGMRLERHFGSPQEIHWSIDPAGNLFLLQSRPAAAPQASVAQPPSMDGSPVQRILAEALDLIGDPLPPDFRTARHLTLHDIVQFCHDQAVHEMFAWGLRSCRGKGAAKRLHTARAGQWWVVDLGGAFAPDYDHSLPEIEMADIASPSLHALWAGMHHLPPQEPPASGPRAAATARIRAIVRSGLDPVRTFLRGEKNYFLLSPKYCSLTLHLGSYPARIEAMIDDRRGGSSITFRCKGGSRQIRRIDVLAEILDHFGYRIAQAGDTLTAWAEQESGPIFFDRLKILGHLAIHAKELDAEMADAKAARLRRDTFIQTIQEMLRHE